MLIYLSRTGIGNGNIFRFILSAIQLLGDGDGGADDVDGGNGAVGSLRLSQMGELMEWMDVMGGYGWDRWKDAWTDGSDGMDGWIDGMGDWADGMDGGQGGGWVDVGGLG